ncbi:MAG: hypothetical protein B0D87_06350 [Candidatus Sedimenticola endophacoides]|nr:MAG: hypothetical protein B0D87_06350 [Candidatus Sedimenticola endophacoides]
MASRFWGLGCPKIFHEVATLLYTGTFVRGAMEGKGVYMESSGGRYSGIFVDDELTGEGSYSDPQGNRYQGGFKNWVYHGEGEYTLAGGDRYAGTFVEGNLAGKGVHFNEAGDRYEGRFENWMYNGQGTLTYKSGDVYQGEFLHGYRHGEGTLTYAKPVDGVTAQSGEWSYDDYVPEKRARREHIENSVETLLYNQSRLLDNTLTHVGGQRPGTIDLYFVGIAGYGKQDVFLKEIESIHALFQSEYAIGDRGLILVNNDKSSLNYPLATRTSIKRGLQRVAERMDRDEDILFLYLTSHGGKDHRLSLSLSGLSLPDIDPQALAEMLDSLGIKYRVIMVSACYSGGFVDPLKNDHTLVMTAAAKDRKSYGCSDENDITDFARAYFQKALPEAEGFESAFRMASEVVAREEKERKVKKPSQPQIAMGSALRDYLNRWRGSLPPAQAGKEESAEDMDTRLEDINTR